MRKRLDESEFQRYIRQLTTELPALEGLKNQYIMLSTLKRLLFDWILFILAGIKENYKS